jgi:hypothetical protein
MSGPKEQPPRKLSGHRTDVDTKTLERGTDCARRRDSNLRHKDRGGITRGAFGFCVKVVPWDFYLRGQIERGR